MKKVQGTYIQLAKSILTATHLTNPTSGEVVEVTLTMKVLYAYMRDCYFHFTESSYCKGYYNESDESMANNIGSSRATVKRALKSLVQCGLVESSGGTLSRKFIVKDAHETTWAYSNDNLADWKAQAPERAANTTAVKAEFIRSKKLEEQSTSNSGVKAPEKPVVKFKLVENPVVAQREWNPLDDDFDPFMDALPNPPNTNEFYYNDDDEEYPF